MTLNGPVGALRNEEVRFNSYERTSSDQPLKSDKCHKPHPIGRYCYPVLAPGHHRS